jgi:hypothetical protein
MSEAVHDQYDRKDDTHTVSKMMSPRLWKNRGESREHQWMFAPR